MLVGLSRASVQRQRRKWQAGALLNISVAAPSKMVSCAQHYQVCDLHFKIIQFDPLYAAVGEL